MAALRSGFRSLASLVVIAGVAHANTDRPWVISVNGGWYGYSMNAVDTDLAEEGKDLERAWRAFTLGTATSEVTKSSGGGGLGISFTYHPTGVLGFGGRIGRIRPGEMVLNTTGRGSLSYESLHWQETYSPAVIPVMAGVLLQRGEPGAVRFRLSAFVGIMLLNIDDSLIYDATYWDDLDGDGFVDTLVGEQATASVSGSGSGFGGELGVGIAVPLSASVDVTLDLSYRVGRVSRVIADASVDIDGDGIDEVQKGESFNDVNGKALKFDLGGADARLGLQFSL